jgi:hypothetical protein
MDMTIKMTEPSMKYRGIGGKISFLKDYQDHTPEKVVHMQN